ncbi:CPT2-like protein, partial [Mya arenaria]
MLRFRAVSRINTNDKLFNNGHRYKQIFGCRGIQVSQALYSTSVGNDFIHESIVPSDHFQKSLPHLPIPKIENTLTRYLNSQSTLLGEEQFNYTKKSLHDDLVARDKLNKQTSYVTEPWFDMYLRDRKPVSLTHNPFITFTDDPNPKYMDQLLRATNMVMSSLRRLPKSVSFYGAYWYKAFPLDMSQYANLFNSTRIPRHNKDELVVDETAKHLLVMRKGHMYLFDAIDRDGNIVSPDVVMAHIKYILDDPRPQNDNAIGVLTTLNRDKWATVRTQLCNAGEMNESAFFSKGVYNDGYMKLVDSALFVLVLDDDAPADPNAITRNFLHGDGTNRWFDKSFSLIITKDAKTAVNFEHSWGDGVAVLRYFNEVWKETTTKPFVHPDTVPANVHSDRIVQKLERCASLDVDHLEYYKFNKQYLKDKKLSPDSVLQFAIQLAYYKQFGKTVPTYESCSTAAFKKGRTETIRSATKETKRACAMVESGEIMHSVQDLTLALQECSTIHSKLTKEAAMGQGWDRHLFAMKYYAEQAGTPLPELYKDPAYNYINQITLSTSTLTSPAVVIGGFGAVTPNGYGVGYAVENERIGFNVTNYPPETNVHEFVNCLRESLDDLFIYMFNRRIRPFIKYLLSKDDACKME